MKPQLIENQMEEITINMIEKLKDAESKDQMLAIVTQKLQTLIRKFEDRIFTTQTPSREYQRDKNAKEEIRYIKAVLEGNREHEVRNPEKFSFIKQQLEQVSYRFG
ncbi:hypothetical protein [Adhaeribacter radiodurans]|uniref:Uncharacterized protein n=1 Tax=Adhaeribacter radiodurans TaxID=2745197 RepID=A0A7L7L9Q6_9BACT|nr:hypothetical protein [Adhaeribacter radiodurans]QMU29571.1 hypothetical protein HUW48_16715 [Adhaeribacter radiodurans]